MQTDTITLRELTIRYAPKTDVEGQPVVVGRKLTTPAECGSVLVKLLQDQPGEVFAILCMSGRDSGASTRGIQGGAVGERGVDRALSQSSKR